VELHFYCRGEHDVQSRHISLCNQESYFKTGRFWDSEVRLDFLTSNGDTPALKQELQNPLMCFWRLSNILTPLHINTSIADAKASLYCYLHRSLMVFLTWEECCWDFFFFFIDCYFSTLEECPDAFLASCKIYCVIQHKEREEETRWMQWQMAEGSEKRKMLWQGLQRPCCKYAINI